MATAEQDYYELLGVPREATHEDIKRAFRRLARELHPDVSEEPDAETRFRAVAEAYEVLSDPERRSTYDRFGHAGLRGGGFRPMEADFGSLSDVFAAFFGETLFGQGRSAGPRPARGPDVAAQIEIDLADAARGTSLTVGVRVALGCETCGGTGAAPGTSPSTCPGCAGVGVVQQVSRTVLGQIVRSGTCPRCDGSGQIVETPCERCEGDGRTLEDVPLELEVPAGIHDGQRIRVRGAGHAGTLGGPPGDVYVTVRVRPLRGVERVGDDLLVRATLTMTEAALGTTVSVPTPDGSLDVELGPGTQPGAVHAVRGRGMPSLETGRRGDLLVRVDVRVPTKLTGAQRAQVLQLENELGPEPYRDEDDDGFLGRLKNAFR
jgi:molecular chaperone DnaJ